KDNSETKSVEENPLKPQPPPVKEEAPIIKNNNQGAFDYDKCVPVVEKIVDAAWAKTVPIKELALAKEGSLSNSKLFYVDTSTMTKGAQVELTGPAISGAELLTMVKRMAQLEERMVALSKKEAGMPTDKEQMLSSAMSRIEALEQELSSAQKALKDSMARQEELVAYIEKKKKKKGLLRNPFR
ncbi:hypothetical protein CRG98_043023, partial [Punica granatum]